MRSLDFSIKKKSCELLIIIIVIWAIISVFAGILLSWKSTKLSKISTVKLNLPLKFKAISFNIFCNIEFNGFFNLKQFVTIRFNLVKI